MRRATYALAAWTLFVFVTRIRNAADADESLTAYLLPVALVALACLALSRPRRWGRLLALATSVAWLVRVPMILGADHEVGFKVVHTALAVVSWALAAWTLRSEGRARRPVTAPST